MHVIRRRAEAQVVRQRLFTHIVAPGAQHGFHLSVAVGAAQIDDDPVADSKPGIFARILDVAHQFARQPFHR